MSWLTPFRKNTEYGKQSVFATVMHVSTKTVQRWENHHPDHGPIPFGRIAALLGADEMVLRQAHATSLESHQVSKQDEAIQDHKAPAPVDKKLLKKAVARKELKPFHPFLLEQAEANDMERAVELLAGHIQRGEDGELQRILNQAIGGFLEQATKKDEAALRALRELYPLTLLACAVPLPSLKVAGRAEAGSSHEVHGVRKAHTLIFAIDRTRDLKGHRRLARLSEDVLDDSPDTTLCIDLNDSDAEEDNPQEWVHHFVCQVGRVAGFDRECPPYHQPNSEARFRAYCADLDDILGARNEGDFYLMARQQGPIPAGVFDLLKERLPSLHLFECKDSDGKEECSVMRGRPGKLGSWMARGIHQVDHRLKSLGLEIPKEWPLVADARSAKRKASSGEKVAAIRERMETAVEITSYLPKIGRNLKNFFKALLPRW